MPVPEGFPLRVGLVLAGMAVLVLGVVVFVAAAIGLGQASAAFFGCLNNYPTYPPFGVPTACTDAMGAMATYQGLEALGGILGVVGLVVLVIGLVLQPERPVPMTAYYPPPVYGPPPGYSAPQGPQNPPPQP